MFIVKKGRLTYSEPGGKKKDQVYECELWDNKVIDLTGIGKYVGAKKSINLVRCREIEPDNYTSTRFTVLILGGYSHDLQASSENDRTSWIDCICDLCGISNPLTANVPKQKKTLPPLLPPKLISEEKRKEEERGIYEDMSDEGDDEEYIAPSSVGPLPPDEGGVLEYHYPSVDRRIRPASVHDDYGGAPVTSSSGGGMFDHDEEDDDEYIDPTIPAASMRQIPQALGSGPGYMNTNTLNGKDLQPTKYSPKSFTLPHRSPSMKERTPAHHVTARKPLTPPSSRKMSGQPFDTGGTSNELMDKLKRRKNKVEEDSDSVFEPTRPTPPTVHSKPVYQNTGLDKPPTIPSKATSPKPPSRSGKVSGSKPQNNSSSDNPSACPSWRQKQPQLPVHPPWLKQKRDSKPSLPVQDPPWLEQKKASKDRFDNSYPLPTETAPAVANERRFDKPYPLPTETAVPSGHRFDKPFPLPTEPRQAVKGRGKWREKEGDSPPPPLPPGRTSSKRDMFEAEKSVSPADRKAGSRKPLPPPACKKPIREVEDDFDFPTADQLRAKTNRFSQPASEPQPPLSPRNNSSSASPDWGKKQPQLPVKDPPWLKQKRDSKPFLPVQGPPWLGQNKDRFDNPYPVPTETTPAVACEHHFDKPFLRPPPAEPNDSQFTVHKVLEDCPLPNKEIVIEVFDSKGGNINIKQHDVLIHIPENAIGLNDLVEIKACGNLVGPYKLPEGYERVSAFVWVSAAYKFQKYVQMYLQHFYAADDEDDIKDLCLLTANEDDKVVEDDKYSYMMHEDDIECYFEADCDECYILTKSWCTKCVAKRKKIKSSDCRCLGFGYLSRPISVEKNVRISFEICFCYSLSDCIQTIQEQHEECILLKKAPILFKISKSSCLCLDYHKQCSGWNIVHTGKQMITSTEIDFQNYEYQDLEALEKVNAYPPRFHLTFCNNDSIKHLSISITVQLEKSKQKSKSETLNFFVDTLDYAEFTQDIDVAPLSHSEPQQQVKKTPKWKEYNVFMKYFATIAQTLTDIDNLFPHFLSKGTITNESMDEIKSKPRHSDRLRQVLKHIENSLKVNDAENFYTLLDVMSSQGSISTKKLAATMRGELQSQSDHEDQQSDKVLNSNGTSCNAVPYDVSEVEHYDQSQSVLD